MKTIEATGDKQTEDVKKFRDKKTGDNNCQKKKDGSKSSNKEKKNEKKNSESSSEPTCRYCRVNNVMQKEQSVPRSSKRVANVKRRAISRPCAAHRKKCSNSKETKKALKAPMKVACKWKLSLWYRLKQSSGLQMSISLNQLRKTSQQPYPVN